jgi:uncharacterized protein DUF6088
MPRPLLAAQTSKRRILTRIGRFGPGKTFAAKDFLDIASRSMVDVTLASIARNGKIRRIRRGLYDVPKRNEALGGLLSPNIDEAARTLARRYRWKVVPEGAWAANLLGISTQVPARIVYLSDGPSTKIRIGKRTIAFKHARPQALAGSAGTPGLVVQALRYLGKDAVNRGLVLRLRRMLPEAQRRKLVRATRYGVDWIYDTARKIAGETK